MDFLGPMCCGEEGCTVPLVTEEESENLDYSLETFLAYGCDTSYIT